MSLTKRTWTTPIVKSHTLTFTGSVSGATTKLTMVFQAASAIYGIRGTINVYVNGTKHSCTWTTNKTETLVNTKYKTKMTSAQITISKPFFTLKLTDSNDNEAFYEETFSFYEIEKTPTAATCSGGVMDGTTKSKVTFTTSRSAAIPALRHPPRRNCNMPFPSPGAMLCRMPRQARRTWYARCFTAAWCIRASRLP